VTGRLKEPPPSTGGLVFTLAGAPARPGPARAVLGGSGRKQRGEGKRSRK
jgi:hypothetical protein